MIFLFGITVNVYVQTAIANMPESSFITYDQARSAWEGLSLKYRKFCFVNEQKLKALSTHQKTTQVQYFTKAMFCKKVLGIREINCKESLFGVFDKEC